MDRDSIDALIAYEIAELRSAFPRASSCQAVVESHSEDELAKRYSVRLDVRAPQQQVLISGKSKHDPHAAVYAAFEQARAALARDPLAKNP